MRDTCTHHFEPQRFDRVDSGGQKPKTIEKPLLAMVFGPKTIGKPLLPMVLGTKNHRKTIDINGDLPSIHSMAMVSIKAL